MATRNPRLKRGEKFLYDSNTGAFCTEGAEIICFQKLNPETATDALCKTILFYTTAFKFSASGKIFENAAAQSHRDTLNPKITWAEPSQAVWPMFGEALINAINT